MLYVIDFTCDHIMFHDLKFWLCLCFPKSDGADSCTHKIMSVQNMKFVCWSRLLSQQQADILVLYITLLFSDWLKLGRFKRHCYFRLQFQHIRRLFRVGHMQQSVRQSLEGGRWRQQSSSSKLVPYSIACFTAVARPHHQSSTDSTSASAVWAVGAATHCAAAVEQEIGAKPDCQHKISDWHR